MIRATRCMTRASLRIERRHTNDYERKMLAHPTKIDLAGHRNDSKCSEDREQHDALLRSTMLSVNN